MDFPLASWHINRDKSAHTPLSAENAVRSMNPATRDVPDVLSYSIEFEQEVDGRWIAEIAALPGVMVYGATKEEATAKVEALGNL